MGDRCHSSPSWATFGLHCAQMRCQRRRLEIAWSTLDDVESRSAHQRSPGQCCVLLLGLDMQRLQREEDDRGHKLCSSGYYYVPSCVATCATAVAAPLLLVGNEQDYSEKERQRLLTPTRSTVGSCRLQQRSRDDVDRYDQHHKCEEAADDRTFRSDDDRNMQYDESKQYDFHCRTCKAIVSNEKRCGPL